MIFLWSPSERAVIHYCEGDLMVDVYDTEELARQAVRDAIAEHPCP